MGYVKGCSNFYYDLNPKKKKEVAPIGKLTCDIAENGRRQG
jgi:hypothetical protein